MNKSFLRLDPISLSQCWFSLPIFVADAVMDKGESAGVFAQLHRNWKWHDLGRRTWGRTSKFSKQLHGKWIQFPAINLKNYISMKCCWTLCSKYAKRIFSTCSFKSLSGCTDLHLRNSHLLFSLADLKCYFSGSFRLKSSTLWAGSWNFQILWVFLRVCVFNYI